MLAPGLATELDAKSVLGIRRRQGLGQKALVLGKRLAFGTLQRERLPAKETWRLGPLSPSPIFESAIVFLRTTCRASSVRWRGDSFPTSSSRQSPSPVAPLRPWPIRWPRESRPEVTGPFSLLQDAHGSCLQLLDLVEQTVRPGRQPRAPAGTMRERNYPEAAPARPAAGAGSNGNRASSILSPLTSMRDKSAVPTPWPSASSSVLSQLRKGIVPLSARGS